MCFRKKYPKSRSKDAPLAVYAGPEYFRKKNVIGMGMPAGPAGEAGNNQTGGAGNNEAGIEDVYGGPEWFSGEEEIEQDDGEKVQEDVDS